MTKDDNKTEEPREITELDKEVMLNDYISGLTVKEVAAKHKINYRRLLRIATDSKWTDRKAMVEAGVKDVANIPNDVLQDQAITKILRVLHKIAEDTEKSLFNGDDALARMNIKSMVDSIDKIVRLKMHVANGGVETKNVNVRKQTVDWNKLIEQSVEAKKKFGEDFDEKEFLKDVIDAEAKDNK